MDSDEADPNRRPIDKLSPVWFNRAVADGTVLGRFCLIALLSLHTFACFAKSDCLRGPGLCGSLDHKCTVFGSVLICKIASFEGIGPELRCKVISSRLLEAVRCLSIESSTSAPFTESRFETRRQMIFAKALLR